MKIIKQRERKTNVRYYLSFEWSDTPGCGFNFDCDEKGNVLLTDANSGNYQKCINGEYDVIAERKRLMRTDKLLFIVIGWVIIVMLV